MREKLLTTREASQILGISEKEVIELANQGKIPSYRIAGEFLRFEKKEILRIRDRWGKIQATVNWRERIADFFYFNDFYILSLIVILLLVWIILKGI